MQRFVPLRVARVVWALTWRESNMTKLSKRKQAIAKLVTPGKSYALQDAIALLKQVPHAKFDESVELAFNLGIDVRKSEQAVRGAVVLPKGTGKKVRVAVFTSSGNQDAATKAGADLVGLEDLAEQ